MPIALSDCPSINVEQCSLVPDPGANAQRVCCGMRFSIQRTPSDSTIVIDR